MFLWKKMNILPDLMAAIKVKIKSVTNAESMLNQESTNFPTCHQGSIKRDFK